jgi:phage terminase small subunit
MDVDGIIEYKFWDKNSAQERAAKIVGAFEKDNKQQQTSVAIGRIELVPLGGK